MQVEKRLQEIAFIFFGLRLKIFTLGWGTANRKHINYTGTAADRKYYLARPRKVYERLAGAFTLLKLQQILTRQLLSSKQMECTINTMLDVRARP